MRRWSALSCEQLVTEVGSGLAYEVEAGGGKHQVEVEIQENADNYVRVSVAVDDGGLPGSIAPVCGSFIRYRPPL